MAMKGVSKLYTRAFGDSRGFGIGTAFALYTLNDVDPVASSIITISKSPDSIVVISSINGVSKYVTIE